MKVIIGRVEENGYTHIEMRRDGQQPGEGSQSSGYFSKEVLKEAIMSFLSVGWDVDVNVVR